MLLDGFCILQEFPGRNCTRNFATFAEVFVLDSPRSVNDGFQTVARVLFGDQNPYPI